LQLQYLEGRKVAKKVEGQKEVERGKMEAKDRLDTKKSQSYAMEEKINCLWAPFLPLAELKQPFFLSFPLLALLFTPLLFCKN
jgi:hypothetical protein